MPSNSARQHHNSAMQPTMKRWDGHKRTAVEWSGLHREPALWSTNGNCLIHLYAKGQSDIGPSFRIDFSALIKARCYTFIEKYLDKQGRKFDLPKLDADWKRLCPKRTVSLYIPAVPGSTRSEIARQHLGIRNFLAWVTGLALVGSHLGGEIVALFRNLVANRPGGTDCVKDLLAYIEYAGYLDIVAQPNHALAMLYVSEFLHHDDLYTRAFVHCVGMGERLYHSTEYMKISLVTRKLIRTARQGLENKLQNSLEDISSFLDEELSDANLGLPPSVRGHLDRFRSALFAFYTAKFGYFPPRDFDARTIEIMAEDFEALYELLVDDGVGTAGMMGGNNGGGLCTLQIIRAFDNRNAFDIRQHPLPLLPAATEVRKTRRMSWLGRGDKDKPYNRLVAHTALIKASNWRETSFKNGLVQMYREFEGASLQPSSNKADKMDSLSITDARKIRWILIYAMCQVLGSVVERAPQVEGEQAPYFLTASVAELPPWNAAIDTTMSSNVHSALPTMPASADQPWQPRFTDGLDIKPDIDYLAMSHTTERQQPERLSRRQSMPSSHSALSLKSLPTSNSASSLTRRSTIRNSIKRRLRPRSSSLSTGATAPQPLKGTYHEIVVHGYGNGTNEVKLERRNTVSCDNSETKAPKVPSLQTYLPIIPLSSVAADTPPKQGRSDSNRSSNASSIATLSSQGISSPATPGTISTPDFEQAAAADPVIVRNSSHRSLTQRYPMKSMLETMSRTSSKRRGSVASNSGKEPPLPSPTQSQQHYPSGGGGIGLSRGSSFRKSLLPENWTLTGRTAFESNIDEEEEVVTLQAEADEWVAMQAFLDSDVSVAQLAQKGMTPGWEQYNDLGGLTEVR